MKKLLLPLLITSALTGCASFPDQYDKKIGHIDAASEMKDSWSNLPSITYLPSEAGISIKKYGELPDSIGKKLVALKIATPSGISIGDLITVLRLQGYNVVNRLSDSAESKVISHKFDGTMIEFLDHIAETQNIAYEYRNGTVFLTETARYSVSLPQHKDLMEKVGSALSDMGATGVRTDVQAGLVYYSAKPDVATYIGEYLDVIAKNSAMITLQVAVLTVKLNRDIALGFDWSQAMAKAGGKSFSPALTTPTTPTTGTTTTPTTGTGTTTPTTPTTPTTQVGQLLAYSGTSGLAYKFVNNNFSLAAAVKALSTYGDARTEQNVMLGTMSGMPVKISSGEEIPYVKSIGSTTTTGSSNVSGSTQTDKISTGLELSVTPNFDAKDKSVVTTVNVDLSSLVAMRELSAGSALGTLTQPDIQKLKFENVGRINAGETIVVGGITYDQLSNNYTNLPGLERAPTGSKSQVVNRNAIYIVIRPSVVVFTKEALKAAQAQNADAKITTVVLEDPTVPQTERAAAKP